jgi:hypothetical protein
MVGVLVCDVKRYFCAEFRATPVEDGSPLLSYSPAGAWTDAPDGNPVVPVSTERNRMQCLEGLTQGIQSYSGQSLHLTAAQGATVRIYSI